jgi:hypothetical protein
MDEECDGESEAPPAGEFVFWDENYIDYAEEATVRPDFSAERRPGYRLAEEVGSVNILTLMSRLYLHCSAGIPMPRIFELDKSAPEPAPFDFGEQPDSQSVFRKEGRQ